VRRSEDSRNTICGGRLEEGLASEAEERPTRGSFSMQARAVAIHPPTPFATQKSELDPDASPTEELAATQPGNGRQVIFTPRRRCSQTGRRNISGGPFDEGLSLDAGVLVTPRKGRDNPQARAYYARAPQWVAVGGAMSQPVGGSLLFPPGGAGHGEMKGLPADAPKREMLEAGVPKIVWMPRKSRMMSPAANTEEPWGDHPNASTQPVVDSVGNRLQSRRVMPTAKKRASSANSYVVPPWLSPNAAPEPALPTSARRASDSGIASNDVAVLKVMSGTESPHRITSISSPRTPNRPLLHDIATKSFEETMQRLQSHAAERVEALRSQLVVSKSKFNGAFSRTCTESTASSEASLLMNRPHPRLAESETSGPS